MEGKYEKTKLEQIYDYLGSKPEYIKPEYKLETTMTFMFDSIKNRQSKVACRQCSSCHGCR